MSEMKDLATAAINIIEMLQAENERLKKEVEHIRPSPSKHDPFGWSRALRLADDMAKRTVKTMGYNMVDNYCVLYPEQTNENPYLEDCIAHLEWRGIAGVVRKNGHVTVIFERGE